MKPSTRSQASRDARSCAAKLHRRVRRALVGDELVLNADHIESSAKSLDVGGFDIRVRAPERG
jgi:hypothetical protein